MSTCPNCGAQHDPATQGRFCDSCGMSVEKFATKKAANGEEKQVPTVRCRFCGVPTPPPICVACGHKVPYPDDWEGEEE